MSLSPTFVQQMYIAYFGRPADPGGLSYFAQYDQGGLVRTFAASAESQALYGSQSVQSVVAAIYQNLFNRAPETAGLAYWSGLIGNGQLSLADAALAVLQGATSTDLPIITNKVQAAASFTAALNTQALIAGYSGNTAAGLARGFLAKIDGTAATLAAATAPAALATQVTQITSTKPATSTFTLTAGVDNIIGTDGNDLITGAAGTFSAADTINGGGGINTLSLTASGSLTVSGSNVTNIQKLAISSASSQPTVTVQGMAGLTDLIANSAVVFNGLDHLVNLQLNNPGSVKLVTQNTALAGNADAVTVTVSGNANLSLTAATPSANEYESLTINAAAGTSSAVSLTTDTVQTSLKNLILTGSGALSVTMREGFIDMSTSTVYLDNAAKYLTSIDASAASGGVQIGQIDANTHSVTLGAGNDTLLLQRALSSADVFEGGGGTNTLAVTTAVTDATMAHVHGFQVLRIDGLAQVTQDLAIASLAGFGTTYQVSCYGFGTGSGILTLNNIASGATTIVEGTTEALNQNLKPGSGANSVLTVELGTAGSGFGVTLGVLGNIAGLGTLNLVVDNPGGPYGQTTSGGQQLTNDLVTAKQIVTGAGGLAIANALVTSYFDASAATGPISLKGTASTGGTIKTGSGNDFITLGTGADIVDTGAGNDDIYLGTVVSGANTSPTGADAITTGSGNDTVHFVGNGPGNGSAHDYAGVASITDFHVGTSGNTDKLDFGFAHYSLSLPSASGTVYTGLSAGSANQAGGTISAMPVIAQNGSFVDFDHDNSTTFFKLGTGVAFTSDVKGLFAAALGTGSISHLAPNGNYIVFAYDTTHGQAVIALVNDGGNASGDTSITAADFTATSVSVMGVMAMSASDYAAFGTTQTGP